MTRDRRTGRRAGLRVFPEPGTAPQAGAEHGPHTLRVWRGVVVGVHEGEVFVELGPRMQGVLSARDFDEPPARGDVHDFTLRGREEELWALSLCPGGVLRDWADMEPGSQVQARLVRRNEGGFEAKVGPLHAFLPLSQCGLPREEDPGVLLGKTFSCEVIEVDPERQRVVLSRKAVLDRAKRSAHEREVESLGVGALVQGRVSRLEPYGAFVRFGKGLQGLIHVSNLSHERVAHPAEVLEKGQHVQARVLSIRAKGKRIALGLKQLTPSPWVEFAKAHSPGALARGTVARHLASGVLVRVAPGVEGFLHAGETGLARGRPLTDALPAGREVVVRVLAIDEARERMSLSRLHADGAPLAFEDLEAPPAEEASDGPGHLARDLGALLREALGSRRRAGGA